MKTKIILTDNEKYLILICKNWFTEKFHPIKGGKKFSQFEKLFEHIYGWEREIDNYGFENCLFYRLLEIHLKICDDRSGTNLQMRELFGSIISEDGNAPIERGIQKLISTIRFNSLLDSEGEQRYELDPIKFREL